MTRAFPIILTGLILAGCTGPQPRTDARLPPVEERHGLPAERTVSPDAAEAPASAIRKGMHGSGAVLALLERARNAEAGGNLDQAANLVERALRIEPENPWLWYRLAHVRLLQGRRQAALELARKALSLTADDALLEDRIRSLIRQAGGRSG